MFTLLPWDLPGFWGFVFIVSYSKYSTVDFYQQEYLHTKLFNHIHSL